jgi:hypothetical protein
VALIATLISLWVLARRVRLEMNGIRSELQTVRALRPALVDLTSDTRSVAAAATGLGRRGPGS